MEGRPAAIELAEVVKSFSGTRVLDGVSFAVPAGEVTVLIGASGAGKTVTVGHIVGLLRPERGAIRVLDRDLARISDDELNEVRREMAVVQQGSLPFTCGLFYSLDVYENVAYPLRERTGWPEERIDESVTAHLGMVGLREFARATPDQLSAGMAKRVAIARALALEARIVIIDDYDSGIDGVRLSLLCSILAEAQRETGATFLLTTHDMTAARRLADHVAVIHEGRIVATGPAAEVLDSAEPLVRQLVSGATSGPIGLRDA